MGWWALRSLKMDAERERLFLANGALLLEKLISSSNGRYNPIRSFSAKQLKEATNNYHPGCIFSKNNLGTWYKGSLEGRVVSICQSTRQPAEFIVNDMAIAAQLSGHRNVLKLLGCCLETARPILVYEFAENGSLYYLLREVSGTDQPQPIPWKSRLKIAREIAHAVAYLHNAFSRPIAHRDINPSNIFLDDHNTAKLSNFSQSISIPEGETLMAQSRGGRAGYYPPEIEITEKVDVYNFGTFLLELLIGIKPLLIHDRLFESAWQENNPLKYYVTCHCIDDVADHRILAEGRGLNNQQQWQAVVELALRCLETIKENRPTMVQVTKQLTQIERSISIGRERSFSEGRMLLDKLIAFFNGGCNVIHRFSADELKLATNNYDSDYIFGSSNLGLWYKGSLEERAITVCKICSLNWQEHVNNELKIAMQLSAQDNILKLLGCCLETPIPILVYEAAESGTLGCQIQPSLPWNRRLMTARQIADAVAYLHTALPTPIIHGKVTISNIFLNIDYVAKLSNFSHSNWIPEDEGRMTHRIVESETSEKIDVFDFGMLLLHLAGDLYALVTSVAKMGDFEFWKSTKRGYFFASYLKYYLKCHCDGEVVNSSVLAEGHGRLYLQQQWRDVVELICRCLEKVQDKRPMMVEVAKKLGQIERCLTVTERDSSVLQDGRALMEELISLYNSGRRTPLRGFSAEELKKATDHYNSRHVFNCSNLGIWYEGYMGKKMISLCKINGMNWREHAKNEFKIAMQLGARKNVLKLLGYCLEIPVPTLVYESAENGTLFHQIHDRFKIYTSKHTSSRTWHLKNRIKIAKQIAREVVLLHTAFSIPIVHGNIKTANIFLDKHYVPKLSSFAQVNSIHEGEVLATNVFEGTEGYMPPEFMVEGMVTEEVDAYSLGVLLIELSIGKNLFDAFRLVEKEGGLLLDHLKNFVKCHCHDDMVASKIMEKGGGRQEQQQWEAMIELAFKCMDTEKEQRPPMVEIARQLRKI